MMRGGILSFSIALAFAFLASPCESLQCYQCATASDQECTSSVQVCPSCMIYRSDSDPTKFERRCCWWNCGADDMISEFNGRPTYFCNSADKCNSPEKDALLGSTNFTTVTTTITTTVSTERTSSQCYECSGPECGKEWSPVSNCPSCIVFRSPADQTRIERRCCWWSCGAPGTIGTYNGIETYFCTGDKCNGAGEELLSPPISTTASTTLPTTSTPAATERKPVQCYECSGDACGKEESALASNCPSCMAYRNPYDQTKIERRCCWWNCGASNTVGMHNGIETYFCNGDKCNGHGVESALSPPITTTTQSTMSTTTVTFTTITTTAVTQKRPIQCYECSGPDCGKEGSGISTNCPSCMVYRNPNDQTKIERRCCWWNCEPTNTVRMYEGIETYFCATDKCNGYGAESALSPPITTTTITTQTTSTLPTIRTTTTTLPTTTTASTMRLPTSSQCYECSGETCGKEGSALASNCPSCMAYRNPNDETIIERRCCWWNCGAPNTVGTHNGRETYFCVGDKCNAYGVESVLRPPVTTTAASTVSTSTIRMVTSTTTTCALNCQNGGIPETEEGCFCYCLENTYGRECEYIDCAKPDVDSDTCSTENQPLCDESETFAFECHHLCGKC